MFVKAKQSGELLTSGGHWQPWTPDGVRACASKIELAHKKRGDLDLEGLLVVSGAGNIIRGERLRAQGLAGGVEDVLGRLATIQNVLVLQAALKKTTPTKVFVADNMGLKDPGIGSVDPYSLEAELAAYTNGQVVLIAGGTGEDNKTSDNAVLDYAACHATHRPDDKVIVLKGTKHDGVYTKDPAEHADAARYATIPASYMLAHYDRLAAVDAACLRAIIATSLSLRVYADSEHDLPTALSCNGDGIGTLIVPYGEEPVLA